MAMSPSQLMAVDVFSSLILEIIMRTLSFASPEKLFLVVVIGIYLHPTEMSI